MYDKIKVVVFCKDEKDIAQYRRLFRFMLKDQLIEERVHRDYGRLETEKMRIDFYIGGMNRRGHRAHYVINLVQDEELHNFVTLPMTNIQSYIKEDPKWRELFADEPEPHRAFLRKNESGDWEFKSSARKDWIVTYSDLQGALFLIREDGWKQVFSDNKLEIYTFQKEREQ